MSLISEDATKTEHGQSKNKMTTLPVTFQSGWTPWILGAIPAVIYFCIFAFNPDIDLKEKTIKTAFTLLLYLIILIWNLKYIKITQEGLIIYSSDFWGPKFIHFDEIQKVELLYVLGTTQSKVNMGMPIILKNFQITLKTSEPLLVNLNYFSIEDLCQFVKILKREAAWVELGENIKKILKDF